MPLLSGDALVGGGGHHFLKSLRILLLDLNPSHLQRNPTSWVDAIPNSVYMSAGRDSTEPRVVSAMLKNLAPLAGHDQRDTPSVLTRPPPQLRHLIAVWQRPAPLLGLSGRRVHAPLRPPRSLFNLPPSAHLLWRNSRACPVRGHGRHAARLLSLAWGSAGLGLVSRERSATPKDSAPPGWP